MNLNKPLTALALSATFALTLSSCAATPADESADDGRLQVVATTTQLADFASQVGGDEINLTGLLAAGASAHHFDPSPTDLLALGNADVLIVNGAGLDEFVDSAIEASGFAGIVIDASQGVDLELAREITLEALDGDDDHDHDDHGHDDAHDHEGHEGHDHDDDHAHDDHASHDEATHTDEAAAEPQSHDDHGHDHSSEHAHDHGDLNPHLWTSPEFAHEMVHEIGHGLADADPAHAELFEQRAHDYMEQLDALDSWIDEQFDRVPEEQRVLVTGHDSLRYYLHDYDIAFVGSLLPSFEDNAEPSAAEIDTLVAAIKASGVKAIFVESSLSPKLAQTVASEAGVNVIDAESLFVDSLGAEGSGAETYVSATAHNTRVILEAWGATVDALPAELENL